MNNINYDLMIGVRIQRRLVSRHAELIRYMEKTKRFTRSELESLIIIHHKMKHAGPMDKYNFKEAARKLFRITNEHMLDRIFLEVDFETDRDGMRDGIVSVNEWFHIFLIYLRGTLEERMKYCFRIYDVFHESCLTRRSMYVFLKHSLYSTNITPDTEKEYVTELCEILLKHMAPDGHGRVTYQDYRAAVMKDRNMLEFLGQCFPTRQVAQDIFSTFSPSVNMTSY